MAETRDQKTARLTNEKYLIMQDMARPGFQLIMTKLNQAANSLQNEYDGLNFVSDQYKAIRIQTFREVVKHDIPLMLEVMMNVDVAPDEPEWTYGGWLRSVQECIAEFIDNTWLKNIKKLFKL